jgi:putative transposase
VRSIKKGGRALYQKIAVRSVWINNDKNNFPILVLCRFTKISSGGFYEWLNQPVSNRPIKNQQLTKSIKEVFVKNRNVYDTRRIAKILARDINFN